MPRLTKTLPAYRKHKQSGQAIVTLNGRDCLLGPHGTKVSRLEYDRLIGEWLQHGRQLQPDAPKASLTVVELIVAYLDFAKGYYRKDDRPTGECAAIVCACATSRRSTDASRLSSLAQSRCRRSCDEWSMMG